MSTWSLLHQVTDPIVVIDVSRDACGMFGTVWGVPSSVVWPSANRAFFLPFRLSRPFVATLLWWLNGATVSGNVDCGIYSADGRRIVSAGGVAQSGVTAIQTVDITDQLLVAGQYFLGLVLDNATGTIYRSTLSIPQGRAAGIFEQATAYPLPNPATFAASAWGYLPSCGFAGRTFV